MAVEENAQLINISAEAFAEIVRKHKMFRVARVGGARAILARHDLSWFNLRNCDLSYADMTGASLNHADARGALLNYCDFFGADLRYCDLQGAQLMRADLRGACLRGARLIGTDMAEVDLREGFLAGTEKDGSLVPLHKDWPIHDPGGADFSGANLTDARLSGAIAVGTNFSDATMCGCKIIRARLDGANFSGANLEGADLSQCDLTTVNMRGAVLINAALNIASLQQANLTNAMTNLPLGPTAKDLSAPLEDLLEKHREWVATEGADGAQLDISGHDMRGTKLFAYASLSLAVAEDAILYGLNLTETQLQAAFLRQADMRCVTGYHADFRGADMYGVRLTNATLRNARFEPIISAHGRVIKTELSKVNFRYADLSGAHFRQATLDGTDFSYANLVDADLTEADISTALFKGAQLSTTQRALLDLDDEDL